MKVKIITAIIAALISTSANAMIIGYVNKGYPVCNRHDQLVKVVNAINTGDKATSDEYLNSKVCAIGTDRYPIDSFATLPDGTAIITLDRDTSWTISKGIVIIGR